MDKKLAKKLYKKAEELKNVVMLERWELNKGQKLTKEQNKRLREIHKIEKVLKGLEEPLMEYVRPKGSLTWIDFNKIMREHCTSGNHINGVIVYKKSNFEKKYQSLNERSYVVNSNNKVWKPSAGGYSLFGINIAGTDDCRLERTGWDVEYCYLLDEKQWGEIKQQIEIGHKKTYGY